MTEEMLEALLQIFLERGQNIVDEYLIRMGQQIQEIGELIPSEVNRLVQLQKMNANLDAIKKDIALLAERSVADVEEIFVAAAEVDARFVAQNFGTAYNAAILTKPGLVQVLKAQFNVTAGEMANLSRTTIVSKPYRTLIDKAIQAVQSGLEDYNTAIRRAVRETAEIGLLVEIGETGTYETRVGYGGKYTRRLDSAVRQNVLDGIRSLSNDIRAELGKEFGADGIELSAHRLCAPDHLPYQGKQYSNEEFAEIQAKLKRPFFMWNCKHSLHPILLGISEPAYSEEELKSYKDNSEEHIEIDGVSKTRYEWSQEQRRVETAIRRQKDVGIAAQASGDNVLRREAQTNINALTEYYKKIGEKSGLAADFSRTRVEGFKEMGKRELEKTATEELSSIAVASPKFLNKNDRLYTNAQRIKPISGYEDVVVHADKYGFVFKDANDTESNVSVTEFAQMLRKSGTYHGGTIRLIACESAAEGAITAQKLADCLGVEVLAPDDLVYVNEKGEMHIGDPLTNTGNWVRIKPKGTQ